jgi:hypothetical protein
VKPLSHTAIDNTTAPPPATDDGLVTRLVRIGDGAGVSTLRVVVRVLPS